MLGPLLIGTYVFVLALFVGFQVIGKVAPTLHNALIAGMSAIGGISLLGALYMARHSHGELASWLGAAAVAFGAINVVGGLVLTSRMLSGTKKRESA
jgi:NAD(P) transhydrogenase subunit alpha